MHEIMNAPLHYKGFITTASFTCRGF